MHSPGTRRVLGLTVFGVVLLVIAAVNQLIRPAEAVTVTHGAFVMIGPIMAVCGIAAIVRTQGTQRLAWVSLMIPTAIAFVVHSLDTNTLDPYRPASFVTPLVSLGLLTTSALLRVGSWHRRTVERAIVDGLWVTVALAPIWWTLGINQVLEASEAGTGIQIALGATAIIAVVAAADGLVSIPRVDPADRPTLTALALSAVGTGVTALLQVRAGGEGWNLAYIGIELAWHASSLAAVLAMARPWVESGRGPLTTLPPLTYVVVTAVPVLASAPVALAASFQQLAAIWALALVGTFGLRTWFLLRENDALTHQLHHDSHHDQLTGFGNRRMLEQRLAQGGEATVIYLDLDGFKAVNDTHGHQTGDALLIAVGERLRTAVRDNDLVIRLGGDEFAVLLDADTPLSGAEVAANRLMDLISTPFEIGELTLSIGASVGLATGELTEQGSVLQQADQAMYRAKRAGGQRLEFANTP